MLTSRVYTTSHLTFRSVKYLANDASNICPPVHLSTRRGGCLLLERFLGPSGEAVMICSGAMSHWTCCFQQFDTSSTIKPNWAVLKKELQQGWGWFAPTSTPRLTSPKIHPWFDSLDRSLKVKSSPGEIYGQDVCFNRL